VTVGLEALPNGAGCPEGLGFHTSGSRCFGVLSQLQPALASGGMVSGGMASGGGNSVYSKEQLRKTHKWLFMRLSGLAIWEAVRGPHEPQA
jgi:hypothetical protein